MYFENWFLLLDMLLIWIPTGVWLRRGLLLLLDIADFAPLITLLTYWPPRVRFQKLYIHKKESLMLWPIRPTCAWIRQCWDASILTKDSTYENEFKQCALMGVWKHQHCQCKLCICYHHYFHCIAFVWRTNCQICGQADLSPQVIVHNAQCTIAHVHLRGGGLSIYRWERNSATEQLRLVSVQQCGAFEIGVQQCSLWRHLSYIKASAIRRWCTTVPNCGIR